VVNTSEYLQRRRKKRILNAFFGNGRGMRRGCFVIGKKSKSAKKNQFPQRTRFHQEVFGGKRTILEKEKEFALVDGLPLEEKAGWNRNNILDRSHVGLMVRAPTAPKLRGKKSWGGVRLIPLGTV